MCVISRSTYSAVVNVNLLDTETFIVEHSLIVSKLRRVF